MNLLKGYSRLRGETLSLLFVPPAKGSRMEIIMDKYITTPLTDDIIDDLKAGDIVYISGIVYSARDAAHARLYEMIQNGKQLPFELKGAVIYYLGPTPARPGKVIGSAGPTTASRMDKYAPLLLDKGLKGMIGKGRRSDAVRDSIIKNKAVYLLAAGGAGALLSNCIRESEVIAFDDLGTEAVRKMRVENFPVIVGIDCNGTDKYKKTF